MAFWSSKDSNPARKYRFKVGTDTNNNWWYANTVSLPSFDINTSEYQILNHNVKIPGIPTWQDVTINIVDFAKSVASIKEILDFQHFEFEQINGIRKLSSASEEVKAAATTKDKQDEEKAKEDPATKKATPTPASAKPSTSKQSFIIEQLSSDGKTYRKWTLVNSFIKSVNYGELDYSSDELVSIEITVGYDYATTT